MQLRIIHAEGDRVIAGGSKGVQILDAQTAAVLAETGGYTTDVIAAYAPRALVLTPGNPASVDLVTYRTDLSGSSATRQYNPPNGGRIAALPNGPVYWQSGSKVRRTTDGLTIDTGTPAYDIGAIPGGFVVIYGSTAQAWSDAGQQLWTASLPAVARNVVSSVGYVVAWGAAIRDGGDIVIPVTVLDAATGALVATIEQRGRNLISCAAIDGSLLYVARPKYVTGQPTTGELEVYDLADRGNLVRTVAIGHPPLGIAATIYGAIYVGNHGATAVPAGELRGPVEPPAVVLDPFGAWQAANPGADPAIVSVLGMVGPLLNVTTVAKYAALYALLAS